MAVPKSASSRKSLEGMDELIQSIQEQTLRLKQNLSKSSRAGDSSTASKEAKTLPRAPFAPTLAPAEYHYSRTLIENLLRDNKAFHCEIDDYKQVLEAVVKKCKEAQKELEIERVKGEQLQLVEEQLETERRKTRVALEDTARIREHYLQMLEVTRQSVFELSEQDKEEQVLTEYLSRENEHLREMLGIARLNSDKQGEIDQALKREEEVLREESQPESAGVKVYRQTRLHRKSASASKPKGSFLFAPDKAATEASWDAFLKAKEEATPQQSLDQLEEPK